jgi:16S rRNA processing protein RimM
VLVPFVVEIVPEIDVEAGRVVVDLPPGLLELDEPEPAPVREPSAAGQAPRSPKAGPKSRPRVASPTAEATAGADEV